MKSVKRLMSAERSSRIDRLSVRLRSVALSPGWSRAATTKPASASIAAVSRWAPDQPPEPCETTMSGSPSPAIGQFLTAAMVTKRNFISCGAAAQGDQTAPVSAGPPASAGMSMSLKPAASAIGAAKQAMMTARNANGCIVLDREPTTRYLV
jgi:hypothetical protein